MLEETNYGNKKRHRIDLIIIWVSYFFLMFGLPILLRNFNIAEVYIDEAWVVQGDADLALLLFMLTEFLLALIVSLTTYKAHIYLILVVFSFLVKLVLYILVSVILFWSIRYFLTDFDLLLSRLVIAYRGYNGVFFPSILFCIPTLLGVEIGKLIKNKYQEKKLVRLYVNKN